MINNKPHFAIRIPKPLLDKIKYIADFNGRSANKEIEMLIRRYVESFEKEYDVIKLDSKKDD